MLWVHLPSCLRKPAILLLFMSVRLDGENIELVWQTMHVSYVKVSLAMKKEWSPSFISEGRHNLRATDLFYYIFCAHDEVCVHCVPPSPPVSYRLL